MDTFLFLFLTGHLSFICYSLHCKEKIRAGDYSSSISNKSRHSYYK